MDNFEYSKEEYERNFILKKNLDKSKEVLDKSKSIGKQTDEKIKDSIFILEKNMNIKKLFLLKMIVLKLMIIKLKRNL